MVYGFVLGFWLLWGSVGSLLAPKLKLSPGSIPDLYRISLFLAVLALIGLRFSRFLWGRGFAESLGVSAAFWTALASTCLLSLPFGLSFYFNVALYKGEIALVYLWESFGAGLAGLIVDLIFIPRFTGWQALAIIGIAALLLILIQSYSLKGLSLSVALGLILAFFWHFDFPSQQSAARPFKLLASRDGRFGRLQIIKIDEQLTLYHDGLVAMNFPNPAEAEEIVHFALMQRPEAKKVLLIGGGLGAVKEVLKYPDSQVVYVETDPDSIGLIQGFLPPEERAYLESPRVKVYYLDGRAFLNKTAESYEVIVLALPGPATAQVNRFYTQEFFFLVKKHLTPSGIVSLRVTSAENYQNFSLRRFLGMVQATLEATFSRIEIIPGETNIFLASDGPIDINLSYFAAVLKKYNIETQTVIPQILFDRLNPWRHERLNKILALSSGINSDLRPRAYFYYVTFLASHFGLREERLLGFLAQIPSWLVLISAPLALFLLFCPLFLRHGKKVLPGWPLLILGFTTMMAEILVLLWFQTRFGFIYEKISLLVSLFMFGLFAGARLSKKIPLPSTKAILLDQIIFLGCLFGLLLALPHPVPGFVPYFFLFLFGLTAGHLFIVCNSPLFKDRLGYGLGYGLDLAGSFLAAALGPVVFFPVLGLPLSVVGLLILNLLGLLTFIAATPGSGKGS